MKLTKSYGTTVFINRTTGSVGLWSQTEGKEGKPYDCTADSLEAILRLRHREEEHKQRPRGLLDLKRQRMKFWALEIARICRADYWRCGDTVGRGGREGRWIEEGARAPEMCSFKSLAEC